MGRNKAVTVDFDQIAKAFILYDGIKIAVSALIKFKARFAPDAEIYTTQIIHEFYTDPMSMITFLQTLPEELIKQVIAPDQQITSFPYKAKTRELHFC